METFEDLGAAIGTVSFDSEALIERAVVAGRRHQRRRRIGAGVGLLAVGAVVVGASLHSAGSPTADGTSVAGQTTASALKTPDQSTASALKTPTSSGDTGSNLPTADLTDARLASRLPVPGDLVSATDGAAGVDVERTIDPDGSGVGSVSLALEADTPLSQAAISGADQKCGLAAQGTDPESCQPIADGWMFTYAARPDVENASAKALDWSATVLRKDGTSVSVHATNYVDPHDPTRQVPVLTQAQVEQLATDPVWFQPAS
jgi:hypothetical protein